ncbi:putative methyltransferase-domain-containing protein [Blyttiomyces helicus]|uniref:Putative methyltransferase-domain-containing protein n=1 Tax=Blyttiomyces helicus TaxID=388810 RepID=A0A4P9VW43_9FUNG|nr:putative methyltransferase-domain-containing protein [Blyttiomyces helicus]|eukprot:RKO83901.1 putative methyltransferase-domain-containing protein [Blyttiomyces helicus]
MPEPASLNPNTASAKPVSVDHAQGIPTPSQIEYLTTAYTLQLPSLPFTLTLHQDQNSAGFIAGKVWPSGPLLASHLSTVFSRTPPPCSLRIVELGAGTGVGGLAVSQVLSQHGAPADGGFHSVVLTDLPEALPLLSRNITANPTPPTVHTTAAALPWGSTPPATSLLYPDYLIAADVIYWPQLFTPLVDTLRELAGPQTTVVIAYRKRVPAVEEAFFELFGVHFAFEAVPRGEWGGGEGDWEDAQYYVFRAARRAIPRSGVSDSFAILEMMEMGEVYE